MLAVEIFERELKEGSGLAQALKAAVTAAQTGMQATIKMKAVHGRASWHQDVSIGVQDAGATAMYFLIKSFAQNLISQIIR